MRRVKLLLSLNAAKLCSGLTLLIPALCFGADQVRDDLEWDGDHYFVYESPAQLKSVEQVIEAVKEGQPKSFCSYGHKGYKAFWHITDGALYLDKLVVSPCGRDRFLTAEEICTHCLFPIPANWYTGKLTFETGRWWGNKIPLEGDRYRIDHYRYEIRVLSFDYGVLVSDTTEVQTYDKTPPHE